MSSDPSAWFRPSDESVSTDQVLDINNFIAEQLGASKLFETNPPVLTYLTAEVASFRAKQRDRQALREARRALKSRIVDDNLATKLEGQLAACGIDPKDQLFAGLDSVCSFADLDRLGDIESLAMSYVEQRVQLVEAEDVLATIDDHTARFEDAVTQLRSLNPSLTPERVQQIAHDTEEKVMATHTLKQTIKPQEHRIRKDVPSINAGLLNTKSDGLSSAIQLLEAKKAHLRTMSKLPPEIDLLVLENRRLRTRLVEVERRREVALWDA